MAKTCSDCGNKISYGAKERCIRCSNISRTTDVWKRFDSHYKKVESGCWEWTRTLNAYGYGQFSIAQKYFRASRISYERFNGKIPPGLFVLHKCDVRKCVNPDHLFLGTQKDNMRDMVAKGRANRVGLKGSANPASKLNQNKVKIIRSLRRDGWAQQKIADKFNVSQPVISSVLRGKTWNF